MLKKKLQAFLKRIGLLERLRSSFLYDAYWHFADRSIVDSQRNEVRFYRTLLKDPHPGILVYDIGANHGQKTDVFLRLGARVVAVDPDLSNQAILTDRFLRYRLRKKPVTVLGKAVSDTKAIATFWVDAPGSAMNTLSTKWVDTLRNDDERFGNKLEFAGKREVETTTLDDMMATYGDPAFVKIDVEGHEPAVLRGLKRPVSLLSYEVNLPEFLPEGLEGVEILGRLSGEGRFNWAVDCQGGVALKEWLPAAEFATAMKGCTEKSVEIFWRCPVRSQRAAGPA